MSDLPDTANEKLTTPAPSVDTPAPGPKTVRFCSNCETDVEPGGKGHCPVCGRFLPDNVVALVHGGRRMSLPPERESRRVELRSKVWADLGGTVPPIIAEVAEDFVSACVLRDQLVEHLEAIGPLTQRGTRRAAMDLYLATSARIERLSAMLSAFRSEAEGDAATRTPSNLPGLERMPTPALERARDLLARLAAGDTLSDREHGQLDVLRAAMRGEVELPADPVPLPPPPEPRGTPEADDLGRDRPTPLGSAGGALGAREPDETGDAVPIRERVPTFHYNDPIEIERRRVERFETMLRTMRHGSGITRW